MAQKETRLEKAGKQTLKQIEQQYEAALAESTGQTAELSRTLTEREERMKKLGSRLDTFMAKVAVKESKSHRVAVDLGGGTIAQVSTELINWGVRAIGSWSKDGFFAHNVDLLQGLPHFVLGLGVYMGEMATRKDPTERGTELVSVRREVISEASKLFAQLGFSNLVRALRVRYADGKSLAVNYEGLRAENAELLSRLKALDSQKKGA
ncbi:MAG: hypothetical protein U1A78_00115 [Polyangia bacterium]